MGLDMYIYLSSIQSGREINNKIIIHMYIWNCDVHVNSFSLSVLSKLCIACENRSSWLRISSTCCLVSLILGFLGTTYPAWTWVRCCLILQEQRQEIMSALVSLIAGEQPLMKASTWNWGGWLGWRLRNCWYGSM